MKPMRMLCTTFCCSRKPLKAIDAGLDPGDLHLRILNGPPISALPSAAAREEITAVPFEQLAEQLQDCTRLLSMLPLQELQGRPRTEAAQLLLLAAFRGHTQLLRLLLLLTAPTAFLDTPELMPELFKEAYLVFGHEDSTASPFSMGWSPLHTAAAGGSVACATALLEADARLAAIATMGGWRPAHVAAWHGRTDVLQLLLATAPETAQASDLTDTCPFTVRPWAAGRAACSCWWQRTQPHSWLRLGWEKQPSTWPALASSRVMPAAAAMPQWCSSCWSCTPAQC